MQQPAGKELQGPFEGRERRKTKTKQPFCSQNISSTAREGEKRENIQKLGQALQPIPRSTKSAEGHRSLPPTSEK